MHFGVRLLGALVITYLVSRLALRFTDGIRPKIGGTLTAHVSSFLLCAGLAGFSRAYWDAFDEQAALVYIAPQLFWLALDIIREANKARTGK